MSPTKTKKPKTPKKPDPQNPEAGTPTENQEPQASTGPTESGQGATRPGVRIVSVAFPSKTARQLRLLASVTGEPMASIVVSAVTRVIAKRLPDALPEIAKAESDDGE